MKGGFRLAIHGRFNSDEGGAFGWPFMAVSTVMKGGLLA
jgi:hypothetical protein